MQLIAYSFKLLGMYIVSVLPLTKTSDKEPLTYFSATEYEPGVMVKVPLRNREVRALVLKSSPAESAKMDLRQSNFTLKKIKASSNPNGGRTLTSKAFMHAVEKFGEFEAQPFAATLGAVLPNILFEVKRKVEPIEPQCTLKADTSAFQGNSEERYSQYRSLIRETFARKKSIFIVVPTARDAETAKEELSKGIEQFTAVFHSGDTSTSGKKEIEKALKVVDDYGHPALTIGTPQFLCLLRTDTETLVLDRENSRSYKTFGRPNLDFKIFAKILSHEYCTRLILGSEILSVDTMHKIRENEINEWGHLKMREQSLADISIVSMVKSEDGEPFKIFSDKLRTELEKLVENRKRVFLFGGRKGLSPTTVCADCETIMSCTTCGAPLVLYGKEKPFFLCHKCGEKKIAKDECAHCGGWRLITLGIGIEGVEAEIKRIDPNIETFLLDKNTAPTPSKALKIVEKFLTTSGSVLIGTEMALHYFKKPVEISAVVSADSLLGVPDLRINEKIMALLIHIRHLGKEKVIFQTRDPENKIFEYAKEGNFLSFFERELAERKKFAFPPFSLFIKIVWEDSPVRAENGASFIKQLLGDAIEIFKVRNGAKLVRYHGLIKIERQSTSSEEWPKHELVEKLRSLPPNFSVFVDPDALL